ncbi:hypothetical protein GCM10010411_75620 [Actinomadura fulvescens]|uniref:Uncharacterized protein n=1 Tax=Actinomadura fulvescens TaxID=46160 RepID=A0ABN3QIG9_9ACTN
MCWNQARAEATNARAGGDTRQKVRAANFLDQVGAFHQLSFAGMHSQRGSFTAPRRSHEQRGRPRLHPPPSVRQPVVQWLQPKLFDAPRDFTRFNEANDADLDNPWLAWSIHLAHQIGEAHGWRRGNRYGVHRALIIVLSSHAAGDIVRYSELFPAMRALDISVERVAEVLTAMGIFHDDRSSSFENWLERMLDGLAAGIREPPRHGCAPCATAARAPGHAIRQRSGTTWVTHARPCWPGLSATTTYAKSPATTS